MLRKISYVIIVFFISCLLIVNIPSSLFAEQEKKEIQIYSNPFGNATYVMSFALAEIINKYSNKLHAACMESKGSSANMLFLQQNPEARKNTIIVASPSAVTGAKKGAPPFREPFTGLRAISSIMYNGCFFMTLDPDIKTIEDLAGKRVAVGPKGSTLAYEPEFVLKFGYDIFDKLGRVGYMPPGAVKDALLDGSVQVGIQSSTMWGEGEEKQWAPIPATEELMSSAKCYIVELDPNAVKKAAAESGYPLFTLKAKKLDFGKSEAAGGNLLVTSNSWWAYESIDASIVREICTIIYDHASEFVKYHATGKGLTSKSMASIYAADENDFHPAAVEFYKEKGMKIGG